MSTDNIFTRMQILNRTMLGGDKAKTIRQLRPRRDRRELHLAEQVRVRAAHGNRLHPIA
jgi:hypothetical protein